MKYPAKVGAKFTTESAGNGLLFNYKYQLGGEVDFVGLPICFLEEVVEHGAVGLAHVFGAAAQGLGGKGDDEPGGVDGAISVRIVERRP